MKFLDFPILAFLNIRIYNFTDHRYFIENFTNVRIPMFQNFKFSIYQDSKLPNPQHLKYQIFKPAKFNKKPYELRN